MLVNMFMQTNDIIAVEEKLIAAIKDSNIMLLEALLHDELLFMAPNGQIVTKEMDLASHRAGEMKVDELSANFEQVNIIGDNAVVVVVYDTKGSMLGHPIHGQFRYVRIWKNFPDGLRVVGGSCCEI